MLEMYSLIGFRAVTLYLLILVIFRVMGKREIGELSLLDLIVFMMIAEMAAFAIEDTELSLMQAVFPMILLMLLQILLSWFSLKSKKFRDLMDGRPSILIHNGEIVVNEMRKNRYNMDDLMQQLREKEVFDLQEVSFAILEPSGTLSVLRKERSAGQLSLPLIMDGRIQSRHLALIGKDENWLRSEMKKQGYDHLKTIFFCTYEDGEWYISSS
ncbi:hypothetical protein KP77_03410 [Jeotgalibacillus alimentarius]|uniref:YetF C-terminal domain-containing protein n=1 Tax=Jeotgalibacillus alimentarius TaxID=135826 RepID=A0A0C2RT13_9BACL|nr:DUF421 domain-containing protein [Jeotgalibacillus alimentarius]KIL53365.1 hypothetical protein KP77_03410 [Jeotgalibacillus alimentarius]